MNYFKILPVFIILALNTTAMADSNENSDNEQLLIGAAAVSALTPSGIAVSETVKNKAVKELIDLESLTEQRRIINKLRLGEKIESQRLLQEFYGISDNDIRNYIPSSSAELKRAYRKKSLKTKVKLLDVTSKSLLGVFVGSSFYFLHGISAPEHVSNTNLGRQGEEILKAASSHSINESIEVIQR